MDIMLELDCKPDYYFSGEEKGKKGTKTKTFKSTHTVCEQVCVWCGEGEMLCPTVNSGETLQLL